MFTELARYGDIVGIRVVNFRNIFVNHPDLIEEVLVGHPRRYVKGRVLRANRQDRKSTRLNSSHSQISYAVFCLKKKKTASTCIVLGEREGSRARGRKTARLPPTRTPGVLARAKPARRHPRHATAPARTIRPAGT